MRILFAGSAEIALPSLEAVAERHEIVGILTNPDAGKGRGRGVCCTPVAELSGTLLPGVPILRPERLGSEARGMVEPLKPDVLVTFAYGRIFGPKFLALFPLGGVNVHPSLLPRWRGCSPLQSAILERDAETGVTVQRIALELDSGDILGQARIPLAGNETAGSLHDMAAKIGADLLVSVLDGMARDSLRPLPQDPAFVTYSRQFSKEDGFLDFSRDAASLDAQIRAFMPWPGAFTFWKGVRLNILEATPYRGPVLASEGTMPGAAFALDKGSGILVQTGDGVLAVSRLQVETKKPLSFKDFLNGNRDAIGSVFGAERRNP